MIEKLDDTYWTARYRNKQTGWDAQQITSPIQAYVDQLKDKSIKILIPGCGNAHEAEYLFNQGFEQVYLADISSYPLQAFAKRVSGFPKEQLLHIDFFDLKGQYDLILEQTFFCALDPAMRLAYVKKMHSLLHPKGKLVGVLFDDELYSNHPPFGGFKKDYESLFEPYFHFKVFDRCYNSIPPRAGRELFILLEPKRLP